VVTTIEPLAGTPESAWAGWPEPAGWPRLDPAHLLGRTVVVLAAHPDDEVLGVGGLVGRLVALGAALRFVWATDGEASHPGSEAPVVRDLAAVRRAESAAALRRLGAARAPRVRLGLPDGGLAEAADDLARRVRCVVHPDDLVLAPWSGDGHPDHEACGAAARSVGGEVLEYPIWTWSWARPGDDRVPWNRALRVDLDEGTRRAKAEAVGCFRSQVAAVGPGEQDGPVLPPGVLAHFARDHEVLLR
jgi:LmbE family N-acetylglucosaminyl deacetylase